MKRERISPQQRKALEIAESNEWVIAEHVYRDAYGLKRLCDRREKENVPAAVRAAASRSLRKLVVHGLLCLKFPGVNNCLILTDAGREWLRERVKP